MYDEFYENSSKRRLGWIEALSEIIVIDFRKTYKIIKKAL